MLGERLKYYARVLPPKAGFELREHVPALGQRRFHRFLIVSPGRAGSQMLVQRCNSHRQAICYGEVLAPDYINWQTCKRLEMDPRALAIRNRDLVRFLDRHVWHAQPPGIRAVGFKLVYSHLFDRRRAVEPLIRDKRTLRVLWLDRRNKFEMCLSRFVARQTKVWRVEENDTAPDDAPPVTVDADLFARSIKMLEVAHHGIAEILANAHCLEVFYEDLVAEPEAWNRRICEFLEIEDRPLVHTTQKQARGSLAERVTNFEELKSRFEGTRWEHCLTHA
jgi:LPS sulfotransferase NodH